MRKKWLTLGDKLALKDMRYFAERFSETSHQDFMYGFGAKGVQYDQGKADAYDDVMNHADSLRESHEKWPWDGLVQRVKGGEDA